MFTTNEPDTPPPAQPSQTNKYKNILTNPESNHDESNYSMIDNLLENEKIHNKSETWNKLDKTIKIQKLHTFAETYGREHVIPVKDIKTLKMFFIDCLDKSKLQKTKDVVYDKDKGVITSIPALHFNNTNRAFTLKNLDAKRVSTIKSLTPRRISEKSLPEAPV